MNIRAADFEPQYNRFGWWNRILRSQILDRLAPLTCGHLVINDALGYAELGDPAAPSALQINISVKDPAFYRAIAGNGSVGAGEAFMDGLWDCDNLPGLMRTLVLNRELLDDMERGLARIGGAAMRAVRALHPNTRNGARRNIGAHYDLGNEFFRLFLSPDLMYSAALWEGRDDTLEAASARKLERICQQLELKASDHVVELGTGWGGFALYAAKHYGCRVTTTTISQEQYELARERIAAAGLAGQVTLLNKDYRDLHGHYDKLVSIEMVEAIGPSQLDAWFEKVTTLLKPDGLAVIQAITIEDHRYKQALKAVDFIQRYIFPGGFIPSISALLEAKTRNGDLALVDQRDFGDSYARTVAEWRRRFDACRSDVRALGFDERFIRMWQFYLAYCEGGFLERAIGVSHFKFARPGWRPRTQCSVT